ncbi:MAG: hypothetical protein HFI69_07225 [Lachnospiraceae bacterium]|jgi:hypothetical protein|nr:hypothetical protein [Lachnospiraceae bacterium]
MLVLYIKEEISLSEEFFDGKKTCLDVKVKMIYDGKDGDIINQYVRFTRVCNEQTALYGRSRRAIKETIRICKDSDVLREYLENKEQEVLDMLMELYDQEEVMKSYVQSEKYEAVQEAAKETAKRMLKDGTFSIDKIAELVSLPIEVIQEIAALQSV